MAVLEGLAAVPTYLAGVEAESAPVAQNSFSSCLPDLYHSCRFTASAHITDETQIKDQHKTEHTYRHDRPPHTPPVAVTLTTWNRVSLGF